MNTALLTWTLALGGWILPELGSPEIQHAPAISLPAPRASASDLRGGTVRSPERSARHQPSARGPLPYIPREQTPVISPSHAARQQMPAVPTAPDAGATLPGQYSAGPSGTARYGTALPGTIPGTPHSPHYSPTGAAQQQHNRVQPARIGAGVPTGSVAGGIVKPFSDYQQRPIISPYLHLERPEGLDFDNYNTLVRPFTEQFQRNNQLQNEIQGLQNNLYQQNRALQQMNRQMDFYEGRGQPRYFQDTGDFFPSP